MKSLFIPDASGARFPAFDAGKSCFPGVTAGEAAFKQKILLKTEGIRRIRLNNSG